MHNRINRISNVIQDFWKLISCPNTLPQSSRQWRNSVHSASGAQNKNNESSANIRCCSAGQFLVSFIQVISSLSSACFIIWTSASTHRINKNGYKGFPRSIPRSGTICQNGWPFKLSLFIFMVKLIMTYKNIKQK